ncbi:ETS-related transcription factor Elf-2b isoform X1 [Seriola aureovittata]|uniref:ETS-related transcription factor Elf-2b isoform X1 n=1 Tax=Seriola aureovittata TaxID=2871759 RepID=UPI0024BDD14D|nr:ETS-related transcription factor Elf-2b isoform X1 [Seriola aureovittata]XP_056223092.1 ETS-related transcription factor Elf-2b isoform X1 [Seriola aureovittata]XP_056223100.1 ETS-related transcription factor Elf-2b isoform X1 [Seriola aureovittata]XP_056223107.1 ETS-related transcription factor Elf-2b isoform X1 [Seriola aureovittata]XP_056223114.1 ETS-related transcription factor Elf-2b isoform X1 [Seriola aureovittata]
MTSVVLVDTGGTVVEYVTAEEDPQQQEGEYEVDLELEGEVEGECEAEEAYEEVHDREQAEDYPAVIVEEVPGASLIEEQSYSAQVLVYDDEAYLMQEVGDEQEVETEGDVVEASVHGTSVHCSDKTIEAAEALLRMDSPSSLREDRSPEAFIPPCVATPDFLHAAMRPDMIAETEVEISTEDCCEEEDEEMVTLLEDPEPEPDHGPVRKRKAGRKPKTHQSALSNGSPDLGIKKKPREGKAGSTTYLWEFLLDLLQDKNTCPRYIKWTQREKGIFKLVDSKAVSKLWGKHKNKPDMNYETMGRALRYYYQRGILAKVEGQRLVYQFKEMPKNIVIIDDDKADMTAADDLIGSDTAASYERVPPPPDMLLQVTELSSPKKPNILRSGNRTNIVQAPVATGSKMVAAGVPRIVAVSGAPDESQTQQSHTAIIPTATGPRTVRVAMQVPVVMTTSLGQKISTVAVQQPAGTTGAAGHTTLLTNTPTIGAAAGNTNSQQKVVIQTIPTMVPATAENGDKITVQLAKIITIPAHQLAQCQLQTSTGTNKPGVGASAGGISLLGSPLTVRALTPVSVAPGTQVMRLTVPTQAQQQTLMVSQPGSIGSGAGVVTVSTANQTLTAQPRIISGVINGSELVIGAPATTGVAVEKLKAMGVQVQAVQMPMAVQQNQVNPKTVQNVQSEDAEVVIKLETPDVTIKTEEPEC